MMKIPECFQIDDVPFDRDEVESFLAERRDIMVSEAKEVEPLIPLHKMPAIVQRRWFQYLAEKAARCTPMNGVKKSAPKLIARGFEPAVVTDGASQGKKQPKTERKSED